MDGLRPTELNAAMRTCRAVGDPAGTLAAVVGEMRRVRGLPVDDGDLQATAAAADGVRGLCRDVPGFEDLLRADDCLGRVYQAMNEPALAAAYRATARSGRKFDDSEIPAVTQLFTPDWVVEFLLHNTLGRAWMQLHPDSRIELPWLVAGPSRETATPAARPRPVLARDLTVLDPACGTMNFGMAALDLLAATYREEMDRAGRSDWPGEPSVRRDTEIPDAVLHHNLFGIDIDPIVLGLARASLAMKLRRPIPAGGVNLARADALFDALPGNWPGAFDAIVTNPPYLSARNLPVQRVRRLKAAYPAAWRDGCACFVDRGLALLAPGGRAGLLIAQSILFTGSYEPWRRNVAGRSALELLAHFGPGLFGVGNAGTLQTAALVLRREEDESARQRQTLTAFRVVEPADAAGKRAVLAAATGRARMEACTAGPGDQLSIGATLTVTVACGFAVRSAGAPDCETASGGRAAPPRGIARATTGLDAPVPVPPALSPSPGTPGEGRGEGAFPTGQRTRPSPRPSPGVPGEGDENPAPDNKTLGCLPFHLLQTDLATLPRGAWAYWASPADREAFATMPRLGKVATPRQGLATTDNARFVRYWWEVDAVGAGIEMRAAPGRWVPYAKGGRFRRWYEAARHRVNWEDDGREIKASIVARYPYLNGKWQWVAKNASWYGRGGITYSYLTSGRFSARRLEPGGVFDVAGSALFPADPRQTLGLLAVLNSSSAARLLDIINPTLNFQVGDLSELPVPSSLPEGLGDLAGKAIALQQGLDRFDETAPDFVTPMPWDDAEEICRAAARELHRLEREIDRQAAALFGLPDRAAEPAPVPPLDRAELARQWIAFAIGVELGRWADPCVPGQPPQFAADMVRLRPADARWIGRLRERLAAWAGAAGLSEITTAAGGLEAFVVRYFFPWHVRRFRRRPVYWALGDSTTVHLLRHDRANADAVRYALGHCGASLPAGWARHIDDGVVNLAPLANWVPEAALRRELAQAATDLAAGANAWSKTAQTVR